MKAAFFALFAFATSALAGPIIAERQLDSQAAEIDKLFSQIQGYTASISKCNNVQDSHKACDLSY